MAALVAALQCCVDLLESREEPTAGSGSTSAVESKKDAPAAAAAASAGSGSRGSGSGHTSVKLGALTSGGVPVAAASSGSSGGESKRPLLPAVAVGVAGMGLDDAKLGGARKLQQLEPLKRVPALGGSSSSVAVPENLLAALNEAGSDKALYTAIESLCLALNNMLFRNTSCQVIVRWWSFSCLSN